VQQETRITQICQLTLTWSVS